MPFAAPNYTQVPNTFFGEPYSKEGPQPGMMAMLGLAETKVACVVMRATFGYHRANARISYSNMALLTGLSQSSVQSAAITLHDNHIIHSGSDGGVTLWEPVMNEEEWTIPDEVPVSKPRKTSVAAPVDEAFYIDLDTEDQEPEFLSLNLKKRSEVRFQCPGCGEKNAIEQSDEVTPCCHAIITWQNNPLWDKHQQQKATDEEAKRRNTLAEANLTPGAKYLLLKAMGTDPQGKCSFKPGEAARVAAFEEAEGVEYVRSVVNRKVNAGQMGRGLIVSVINALPFAAKDFEDVEDPEEDEGDTPPKDYSKLIIRD